jgi:hypothetical protein
LEKIGVRTISMNYVSVFEEVVGKQVKYKILWLKFSEKLLFSINPPISAHALLTGSFGSITAKNMRG